MARMLGRILGCVLAFIIMANVVPEFNSRFLSVKKYEHGKVVQEPYNSVISSFQFYVGIALFLMALAALINISLRFVEISENDRI